MSIQQKNRAYKKGAPFRDARTYVIIAEGEREDEYFSWFSRLSQRIIIKIAPRDEGKSAPKYFKERETKFLEQIELNAAQGDRLWYVLDVDRWKREDIDYLAGQAVDDPLRSIAISNPCFEVWLHLHAAVLTDETLSCSDMKRLLAERFKGGYSPDHACPLISEANRNARNLDQHPDHYFPDRMTTKLYLLGEALVSLIGSSSLGK